MTTINIENKTILNDNTLKAFVNAMQSQLDFDRSVMVLCNDEFVSFRLLTIDEEAKLEHRD